MFSTKHRRELSDNGYTVVEKVIPARVCDECVSQYDSWLRNFVKAGKWPFVFNSVIQRYKIGHYEPTWRIRLACKPVFDQLWRTKKLLTSLEGVAIYRAPEHGQESFHERGQYGLRCDQPVTRIGLHAIQGALFLEPSSVEDWTFAAIKGSHLLMNGFYRAHPHALAESTLDNGYQLRKKDLIWFQEMECPLKRVPAPKGGLVLWDARTVHAICRPLKGRKHSGRIGRVAFVSMAPAVWASDFDINIQKEAYNKLRMTEHWPSQGVRLTPEEIPEKFKLIPATTKLPDIATTEEARKLCGVTPYDFHNGEPNGPEWQPQWLGTYNQ